MACNYTRVLESQVKPRQTCRFPLYVPLKPLSTVIFSRRASSYKNGGVLRADMSSASLRTEVDNKRKEQIEEEIVSGEWPENFSLLNFDDLRAYLEPLIFKDKMEPSALLGEVMSTGLRTTTVDQSLEEINHHFEVVSGLPIVDVQFKCIGVISKKDILRASHGLAAKVGEVMSSPAITLPPSKTVLDAAALMLKEKIHRIPIVNENDQVIGIVTRTDIFKALEGLPA